MGTGGLATTMGALAEVSPLTGDYVLVMTFLRDLPAKYMPSDEEVEAAKVSNHRLSNEWGLLGAFDYVVFDCVRDFANLGTQKRGDFNSPEEQTINVLVPMSGDLTPREDIVEALLPRQTQSIDVKSPQSIHVKSPMFAVVSALSLSPGLFSEGKGWDFALEAVRKSARFVLQAGNKLGLTLSVFASLSGPDLFVILTAPSTEKLVDCWRFLEEITAFTLSDLFPEPGIESTEDSPRVSSGHLFVSAASVVAFNPQKKAAFEDRLFLQNELEVLESGERRPRIRYSLQIRPDSAHCEVVKDTIQDKLDSFHRGLPPGVFHLSGKTGTGRHIGRYTVSVELFHFADLCFLWSENVFSFGWRSLHISSAVTVPCFDPTPVESEESDSLDGNHVQTSRFWELSKECISLLDVASDALNAAIDRREFTHALGKLSLWFATYRCCFYRQDLLLAAVDLLPFVTNFNLAVKEFVARLPSLRLSRDTVGLIALSQEDIVRSLETLHRVLGNRIEHAGEASYPTTPRTLQDGACKVVAAYTALVRTACGLFSGQSSASQSGEEKRRAAIVYEGVRGNIVTHEVLQEFRRYVERGKDGLLSKRANDVWHHRLLAIDISGGIVFEPEYTVWFILHEVAELSDWLWKYDKPVAKIRLTWNGWILKEMLAFFRAAVRSSVQNVEICLSIEGREHNDVKEQRLKRSWELFLRYICSQIAIHEPNHAQSGFPENIWRGIFDFDGCGPLVSVMHDYHPERLLHVFQQCASRIGGGGMLPPESLPLCDEHVDSPELLRRDWTALKLGCQDPLLNRKMKVLSETLVEVMSDVGVLAVAKRTFAWETLKAPEAKTFVDKLFQRCVLLRKSVYGMHYANDTKLEDSGVLGITTLRWILMRGMVEMRLDTVEGDIKTLLASVDMGLPVMLGESLSQQAALARKKRWANLVRGLRSILDEAKEVVKLEEHSGMDELLASLRRCWRRPATSTRAELLLRLWSVSVQGGVHPALSKRKEIFAS